jgi:2-keto-4-pentenoate hydratase/2-oxohepta-3-ene-1,7-dioic acid hydratase in catechol pathway
MRLVTFDDGLVGRLVDDRVVELTGLLGPAPQGGHGVRSAMRSLIERWDELRPGVENQSRPGPAASQVRLRAPIPDPSKILAAPVNYLDHQAEMSVTSQISSLGLFLKSPSSILDPGGTIQLPYLDRRFDQEGELAVIIGKHAARISKEDARSHVFGFTALLDITMRGGEDRSTRKSFSTFTPMGPWIVTADEFGHADEADLRCWVNGKLRQQSNTRDLIWDIDKLVSYASWISPLEPGDVISTGTPAGVGPLADGDIVELEIAGMGARLRVGVSAEGSVGSHTQGAHAGPAPPPPSG